MKLARHLLHSSLRVRGYHRRRRWLHQAPNIAEHATKSSDPLRILFCGADDFSIPSLRAIDHERHSNPSLIQSIDVVCRPDKRTGRGLKQIRQGKFCPYRLKAFQLTRHLAPIKPVAKELHLQLHEIDLPVTWSSPDYVNLIIAVSFGLLIPAGAINAARYGGINLHPSLLPDLRGSSPIHQTLLLNRKHTGLTLQTLHPTKFDHGKILAQTPFPGIAVPEDATPTSLVKLLAPIGAQMLLQGLRNRVFAPPVTTIPALTRAELQELTGGTGPAVAKKMTTEDRKINWSIIKASDIQTRLRVFGSLWDDETFSRATGSTEQKRIVFTRLDPITPSTEPNIPAGTPPGFAIMGEAPDGSHRPIMLTADGECLVAIEFTLEGGAKGEGGKDLGKAIEAKKRMAISP